MEEKLKSANIQSGELESTAQRKYQDLACRLRERDAVIKRLEAQLEKQVPMGKSDQEHSECPFMFMK